MYTLPFRYHTEQKAQFSLFVKPKAPFSSSHFSGIHIMTTFTGSLPLLFLLLLLSFNSGGHFKFVNGLENSWCVAKPSANDAELGSNIEYACSNLRDCRLIQEGGPCFYPNTMVNHASVVMNEYYATLGRNSWNCNFKSSGLIVTTDPSYGGCKYA